MSANNVMPLFSGKSSEIEYGVVQSISQECFVVSAEGGVYSAIRAFSCLLQPEVGDKVMCAYMDKQYFVLAIIERPNHQNMELSFPADVNIVSKDGKLNLHANKTLGINSSEDINMSTPTLNVLADKSLLTINQIITVAKQCSAHLQTMRLISRSIETVADRSVSSFKFAMKNVSGLDQTKAGEMIHTVKNLFSLRSRQAAILAKKDIKVDAQRIHMG